MALLNSSDAKSWNELSKNCLWLAAYGARLLHCGPHILPHVRISGFPVRSYQKHLRNPQDLVPPGFTVAALIWGAPHFLTADNDRASRHGPGRDHSHNAPNAKYKSQAFESMCWLCKELVVMTFPGSYREIDFWPRCPPDDRAILIQPVSFHRHFSSVTGRFCAVSSNVQERVAMAVPPRMYPLLHQHNDRQTNCLDFAGFMLSVHQLLDASEAMVELGCNCATLSMELVREMQLRASGRIES